MWGFMTVMVEVGSFISGTSARSATMTYKIDKWN